MVYNEIKNYYKEQNKDPNNLVDNFEKVKQNLMDLQPKVVNNNNKKIKVKASIK